MVTGEKIDTVSYSTYENTVDNTGVTIDLSNGTAERGDAQGDTLDGIESVEGSKYNDRLKGDAGDNILAGGEGDDTFEWSGGTDLFDGGAGDDTFPDFTLYQGSPAPGGIWVYDLEPIIINADTYSSPFIWAQDDIIFTSGSAVIIGEGVELRSESGDIIIKAYSYQDPNLKNLLSVFDLKESSARISIADNTKLTADNIYIGASANADKYLSYDHWKNADSETPDDPNLARVVGTMSFDPGDPLEQRLPRIIWNDENADFAAEGFKAGQTILITGSKLNNEQYTIQRVDGNSMILAGAQTALPAGTDLLSEETETLAVQIEEVNVGTRGTGPLAVLNRLGEQIGELGQLGKSDMKSKAYTYEFAQGALTTALPILNGLLSLGGKYLGKAMGTGPIPLNLNATPPFQMLTSDADSWVTIGDTNIKAGGDVVIESSANSSSAAQ